MPRNFCLISALVDRNPLSPHSKDEWMPTPGILETRHLVEGWARSPVMSGDGFVGCHRTPLYRKASTLQWLLDKGNRLRKSRDKPTVLIKADQARY